MANEVKVKIAMEGAAEVVAGTDQVGGGLDKLGARAKSAAGDAGTLKDVLAGIATIGTALAVIRMADAVTTLQTSLKLSSASASEAEVAYEKLYAIAQKSRVSFTELGSTYATIARATQSLGITQDRLLNVTQAIGQAMTIGGGSAQSMQAALVQLGQGLGSGTLRGEELNSILEQTPRLAKALADGMDVPLGQLRALGEQGKLTSEMVINALEKSAPQLAREISSATVTVGQAFTMLTNSAVKFVGDADAASGASSNLASVLQTTAGAIDTVGGAINNNKEAFGVIINGLAGAATVAGVAALARGITALWAAVMAGGAANPVILGLMALGAAGGAIASINADWKKSAEGMRATLDGINASISLIENRESRGKGSADDATKKQALIDKRKALNEELAVLEASSAANVSYNAKEAKLLAERATIESAAFSGAKSLDDARKMVKLRTDVVQQGYDQAVDIAKSFQAAMAKATPEEAVRLQREVGARLIASAKETKEALKSFDDKDSASAREAAKGRLDGTIAYYEQLQTTVTEGEKQALEAVKAQHAAGYLSGQEYYAKVRDLAANANTDMQALTELELEAVQRSGLAQKDKASAIAKYSVELTKLRAQELGINATYDAALVDLAAKTAQALRVARKKEADGIEQYMRDQDAAQSAALKALQGSIDGLQQEAQAAELSRVANISLAEAVQLVTIARLEAEQAAKFTKGGTGWDDAQARIDKQKELLALIKDKSAADDWRQTAGSIRDSLVDGFMRATDSAKSLFVELRDSVTGMFKNLVLRPYLQTTIGGALGLSGGAASASAPGGDVGTALNLASGAKAAMGAAGWISNFGASFTDMVYKAGDKLYQLGAENIGRGMMDATSGAGVAQKFAENAQMVGNVIGYANAAYALSQGKIGEAAGAAIGTYFGGPIGSFIGSKIGAAVDKFFGGETRSGATYETVNGKAAYAQGPSGGEIAGADARRMFDSAQDSINATLKAVGSKATLMGYTAGLESSDSGRGFNFAGGFIDGRGFGESGGRGGGQFAMVSQDSKTAFENYGKELGQSIIEALQVTTDIPKVISDMLAGVDAKGLTSEATNTLLANINTVVTAVNGFNTVAKTLPFETLKNLGFDAAAGLIAAAGGLDKLGANLTTYYDNFYSAEEKRAQTILAINGQIAGSGLDAAMATRDQFRAVVEAQDLTTESGRAMYATLISVAGAFAEVTASSESLMDAAGAAESALRTAEGRVGASLRDIGNQVLAFANAANAAAADVGAAQADISQAYWSAQDEMLAAQQRVNEITRQGAQETARFANSIGDFLNTISPTGGSGASLTSLKAQLSATAVLAPSDAGARGNLLAQAQQVLTAAKASSSSSIEYARSEAFVRSLLSGVQKTVSADPVVAALATALTPLEQAQAEYKAAQDKVVQYAALAAVTGANTERATASTATATQALLDAFNTAQATNAQAQADYTSALTLTQGLMLTSSTNLDGLLSSLAGLGDAQAAVATSTTALAEANAAAGLVTTDAAAALAASLGLSGEAAEAFRGLLASSGVSAAEFSTLMGTTGLSASALISALNLSGGALAALDAKLGLSGAQAVAFNADLVASGVSATTFGALLDTTGLSASGLLAVLGGASASTSEALATLDASLGLSGDAAVAFNGLLASSGVSATEFATLMDATGLTATALSTALGAAEAMTAGSTTTLAGFAGGLGNATRMTDTQLATFRATLSSSGLVGDALTSALGLTAQTAGGLVAQFSSTGNGALTLAGLLGRAGDAAAAFASVVAGLRMSDDPIANAYQTLFGRAPEAAGAAYWQASGLTGDALFQAIRSGAQNEDIAAKKLRGFAVGTNYVVGDGPAWLHDGEQVKSRPYVDLERASREDANRLLDTLVKSVDALNARVDRLQKPAETAAKQATRTADVLLRVAQDKNYLSVKAAS